MDFDNNQNGYPPLKPNNGKLFKNKDKVAGDDRPDYSGPFMNERGDEARVAMWLNTAKNGNKYMNITVSEKFEAKQQIPQTAPEPVAADVEDTFFGDNGRF